MWVSVIVLSLQTLGLVVVLLGLVGVKKEYLDITPIPYADFQNLSDTRNGESGIYSRSRDRIVFIVIDALRTDFVTKDTMPHVMALLEKKYGCIFSSIVKAPTVTLPRIKALVSGDIPTYWDIIQNFHSKQITQDNLIWHAVRDGSHKKIAFYGDETWISLFPNEFIRSEGVTSFFVTDFTEVDQNVTRHLNEELKDTAEWDMLILHYLGLDHIGHVHGPFSPLIPDKMREMDAIIKRIHGYLMDIGTPSVLIICGDHGMANIGGHGGNSIEETLTPLLVLSNEEMIQCYQNLDHSPIPYVEQIDIAPTISGMWGMMLPAGSTGKIIWTLFGHLSFKQQIFLAYYNCLHLQKFFIPWGSDSRAVKFENTMNGFRTLQIAKFKDENQTILHDLQELANEMSEAASEHLGEQDLMKLKFGVLIMFFQLPLLSKILYSICSIIIAVFLILLPLPIELVLSTFGILFSWVLLQKTPDMTQGNSNLNNFESLVQGIFWITPILFFSSSYVEEEHYFRYYLFSTGILILIPTSDRMQLLSKEGKLVPLFIQITILLVLHRLSSAWNQTGQKWNHLPDFVDVLKDAGAIDYIVGLSVILIYCNRRQNLLITASTVFSILHKTFPEFLLTLTNGYMGNIQVILSFAIVEVILCITRKNGTGIWTNLWLVICVLLHKHQNLPLLAAVMFEVKLLRSLHDELFMTTESISRKWYSLLSLASAAFFYQGNSNSIASIDVNAGYIGLSEYNEVLVGLLIFCQTFSLPTLIFLGYFEEQFDYSRSNEAVLFFDTLSRWSAMNTLMYSITIIMFRDHLFIWSVFAPKLLYVIGFTIYYALITVCYGIYIEVRKVQAISQYTRAKKT